VATSSGNTGSSLAAYGARYGVKCIIVVNEEAPGGKLAQMQAHGARVFRVQGFGTSSSVTANVFRQLGEISEKWGVPLVVSAYKYCPQGMAEVERLAGELLEQIGSEINHVFVPVGGGGLFTAVCRGFEIRGSVKTRVHAVQPNGCSTVVAAFERGDDRIQPVQSTTRISGLAVPFDIDASLALHHLRRSGGVGITVSDEEVFDAQRMMLDREGIYTEPAGATAFAGLIQARQAEIVSPKDTVVCLVTGHGFKDPDSILRAADAHPATIIPENQLDGCLIGAIQGCV